MRRIWQEGEDIRREGEDMLRIRREGEDMRRIWREGEDMREEGEDMRRIWQNERLMTARDEKPDLWYVGMSAETRQRLMRYNEDNAL